MRQLLASAILAMGCSAVELTRSQVSELRIGGARDAATEDDDDDAALSSAFMKRIKPFNPDIVGSKPKLGSDAGILFRKQSTPRRRLAVTCSQESVVCVNGVSGNETCEDACGTECCVGDKACGNFTGEVCKDGVSCSGRKSCEYANIDLVVNGCNGTEACHKAGWSGGYIGEVYNSCLREGACDRLASNGGNIAAIHNSCLGTKACRFAAASNGTIASIQDSCLGYKACSIAVYYHGIIGDILSSCNGTKSCYYAAYAGGTITEIVSSCVGEEACSLAADDGGFIGGIRNACNAYKACSKAAAATNSPIPPGINDCCNKSYECARANITSLPATCGAAPITAPTAAPSKSPSTPPTEAASPTKTSKGSKSKTGKGSKSKTSKKIHFGTDVEMIQGDQFDFVDDGSMSLNVEESLFDKRQPF